MNAQTSPVCDVLWIVHPTSLAISRDPAALKSSVMASQRLRVAIPSEQLAQSGLTQGAAALTGDDVLAEIAGNRPRVAIFSKLLGTSGMRMYLDRHVRLARNLSATGVPMVVDVCDNYFRDATAPQARDIIALATRVTANSHAMADIIHAHTGREAAVIPDPVEGARQPPAFNPPRLGLFQAFAGRGPARPLELLWFGGQIRSFMSLARALPALAPLLRRHPVALHIMTAPHPQIDVELARMNAELGPGFFARMTSWSLPALSTALAQADLVFLPSDATNPMQAGASTNRLAESLWAGRYAVASGVPSYWEFKDCSSIGDDLAGGLAWALAHPAAVRRRIALAQEIIAERFTPQAVGRQWVTLCTGLLGS